ncbi:MAG: RnfABCDGE type electron transport complex subunit D [Planctomycetota bacterium]
MQDRLFVTASPHLQDQDSIGSIMWSVVVALTPAIAASIYFFGQDAVMAYLISLCVAEGSELICLKLRSKPLHQAADGSAAVTGLLVAMILPPSAPWYCIAMASGFAIAIVKHCFGGLGHNIWNPALAARVFVQFAYPTLVSLSEWTAPQLLFGGRGISDATTQATPLFQGNPINPDYFDLFTGNGISGSLGETCKLALLIGGIYLILRRRIDWRIPLFYIGTVFALTSLLPAGSAGTAAPWMNDPFYHVLSGGLFLGAFFMATDMVTTPITPTGRIIFAIGCGILVSVIRLYGGYPEGVAYSIIIMNTAVPLIDRWCRPNVYGSNTPKPTGT